jgi:hypothetical protein
LFQFPDETAFLQEWFKTRALHALIGFENNRADGSGNRFNFILSNGTRSTQRDEHAPTEYEHFIPADAINKIRAVTIHYHVSITGFTFSDKDGALLWKIGWTTGTHFK